MAFVGVQEIVGHRFLYTCRPAGAKELWVSLFLYTYRPAGAKELWVCFRCYKHIVPTGLKRVSRTRKTTKLTHKVRLQTAPFCINISNNAKDENIGVRSRAIHSASFL